MVRRFGRWMLGVGQVKARQGSSLEIRSTYYWHSFQTLDSEPFFKIISCSARAMQTAPEDRELKQEADAARWQRTCAGRSVRCSREKRLQVRAPRQSRQIPTDREVQER